MFNLYCFYVVKSGILILLDDDVIDGRSGIFKDSDDESDHDEEENWRRIRHEREVYLKKQSVIINIDCIMQRALCLLIFFAVKQIRNYVAADH